MIIAGIVMSLGGAFLRYGVEDPYALDKTINLHAIGVALIVVGVLLGLLGLLIGRR